MTFISLFFGFAFSASAAETNITTPILYSETTIESSKNIFLIPEENLLNIFILLTSLLDQNISHTNIPLINTGVITETKENINNESEDINNKNKIQIQKTDNPISLKTMNKTECHHEKTKIKEDANTTIKPTPKIEPKEKTTKINPIEINEKQDIKKTKTQQPTIKTILQTKKQADRSIATTIGSITTTPGTLGKQIFYIEDDESGIQIYKYDAKFPEIKIGQLVEVKGELSTAHGERRLKITKNGYIKIKEENRSVLAQKVSIKNLTEQMNSKLVQTSGVLIEKTSSELKLKQDKNELKIAIGSNTNIHTSDLLEGDELQIQGILSFAENKLKPRSQTDIVVLAKPKEQATATIQTGKDIALKNDKISATVLSGGTLLVLTSLFARKHYPKFKNKYEKKTNLHISTKTSN